MVKSDMISQQKLIKYGQDATGTIMLNAWICRCSIESPRDLNLPKAAAAIKKIIEATKELKKVKETLMGLTYG